MRVISGKARGTKLKSVPGDTTRPILDRAKENLFNILRPMLGDTRWLDMFAGTGQVGIEALSRGAAEVVFTDNARAAVRTVQENLRLTRLAEQAEVHQTDAFAYLQKVVDGFVKPFDVIYIAPPQYKGIWLTALKMVDVHAAACLYEDGLVVAQIDPQEYMEVELENLVLTDKRKYGRTLFAFYTRKRDS